LRHESENPQWSGETIHANGQRQTYAPEGGKTPHSDQQTAESQATAQQNRRGRCNQDARAQAIATLMNENEILFTFLEKEY
jgi:hypothetical protein